ncbi:serine protease [Chaetomium strumarium]|uniref:Serine protease n=1 Tax=Chaetomium strumarium TaxID=1170767 RepID=A0AAJ0M1W1_9PEZI|nr:serine protease [Chaetomium strumarium]
MRLVITALCGLMTGLFMIPTALAAATTKNDWAPADTVVPKKYIIKYKPDINALERELHEANVNVKARNGGQRGIVAGFGMPGLQGYIVEIPSSELADLVQQSDLIEYIEKDTIAKVAVADITPPTPKRAMTSQYNAPWGLARVSHRTRDHWDHYYYDSSAGKDVRVYVLDTGIRTTHAEFADGGGGGRAEWGANFVAGSPDADEAGHGTHVTGVVAGVTYGVAKRATVVAVKVLGRGGGMSGLLQGLDWAVADARQRGAAGRTVINMSLSGAYTQSVNDGVSAATDAGLIVVAAAGNDNGSAAEWSPASAPSAITVGAIDRDDRRAGFSNWGAAVEIFAPGGGIASAYNSSDSATATMTGTSMAAPHVAGLAAYFIAMDGLSGSLAVTERILDVATKGVGDPRGAADRIGYSADGA